MQFLDDPNGWFWVSEHGNIWRMQNPVVRTVQYQLADRAGRLRVYDAAVRVLPLPGEVTHCIRRFLLPPKYCGTHVCCCTFSPVHLVLRLFLFSFLFQACKTLLRYLCVHNSIAVCHFLYFRFGRQAVSFFFCFVR